MESREVGTGPDAGARDDGLRRDAHRSRALELTHPRVVTAIELPLLGRVAAGRPIEALADNETPEGKAEYVRRQRAFAQRGNRLRERLAAAVERLLDGVDDALLGPQKLQQRALNEMMRSWLDAGQPIPDGLDFNPSRYVSITRK